jgi:hypothetical protein
MGHRKETQGRQGLGGAFRNNKGNIMRLYAENMGIDTNNAT